MFRIYWTNINENTTGHCDYWTNEDFHAWFRTLPNGMRVTRVENLTGATYGI